MQQDYDYEDIKVPVTFSSPIGLLKDFDKVVKQKGSNRSNMLVKLMRVLVNKEKNFK